MRDIRARISQRHGIELSSQQIQDLAARRLEAILDPRTVSPSLLEQLRKGASAAPDPLPARAEADYSFAEDAIYETSNGLVRFFRRLLNPLLKLLLNPAPVVAALQAQARINRDAAARLAEAERRQTEWNALHYQILQRLVTEISRVSIEMQALSSRVESLGARVDFNDKRVRSIEAATTSRSQRVPEVVAPASIPTETAMAAVDGNAPPTIAGTQPAAEGARRRRRRRRGRRGSMPGGEAAMAPTSAAGAELPGDMADLEEGDDDDEAVAPQSADQTAALTVVSESMPVESSEAASAPAPDATASESIPAPAQSNPFSFMPQPAATAEEPPAGAPPEPSEPGPSEQQ